MSKKNRHKNFWQPRKPASQQIAHSEPGAPATGVSQIPSIATETTFSPISPAQLAANRANAQLSTGPRTQAGLEKSSRNAVKTALTGRTVLLPSDDVEEYAAFVAGFERDLKPVGQLECELVQIVADCHWRLRRIQVLEYALYAHGHDQFADAFQDIPNETRYSKILLQTHLTYEKQLRNLQIQEARIDRKASKAMTELRRLQAERATDTSESDLQGSRIKKAAPNAGYMPPSIAAQLAATKEPDENGFEFSSGPISPSNERATNFEASSSQSKAA